MQLLAIHTDDEDHRDVARQGFSRFRDFPGLVVLMEYPFPGIGASGHCDNSRDTPRECCVNALYSIRSYGPYNHAGCCQSTFQDMDFARGCEALFSLPLSPYSRPVFGNGRHISHHGLLTDTLVMCPRDTLLRSVERDHSG